ncbi:hypothetical protein [Parashewanella tropica]|uniref:hypothetical protein n=1 Tax=Parashewanella tropica TaxID=2547970 RepID=UPI00105A5A12|nr:hypothetical protein [Parashewanella tropica]
MRLKLSMLATVMIGIITGCGDSSNKTSEPQLNTLSGNVIGGAGYIQNAKVCMDTIKNAKCDDSEKHVLTGENGEYQFEGLTDEVLNKTPLIAEIGKEAINSDTNKPVGKAYVMAAPANSKALTTLSTQVQNLIAQGVPREEALRIVMALMQVDAEISKKLEEKYKNYQEAAKSSDPKIKEMAMHIKNMSLVMVHNMGNAYEAVQKNGSNASAINGVSIPEGSKVNAKQFMQLVAQKQMDSMPTINKVAHQHAASGVSQDTDFANIDQSLLADMQLPITNLIEQLSALIASLDKKSADMQSALSNDNANQFTLDMGMLSPNIKVNSFNIANQMLNATQRKADKENPALEIADKAAKHDFLVQDTNGDWVRPNNAYQVKPNADNTKLDLVNQTNPDMTTTLTAKEYNLKDLSTDTPFSNNLNLKPYLNLMDGNTDFDEGAKAMQVTSSVNKDVLMVDNKLQCENDETKTREDCHVLVFSHKDNDVVLNPIDLSEITSSEPSNGDLSKLNGAVVASDSSRYIVAELLTPTGDSTDGVANYYLVQSVKSGDSTTKQASLFATGSWTPKPSPLISELTFADLTVPNNVLNFDTTGNTKKDMFYTQVDGKVRQGHKGFSLPMGGVVVNNTAKDNIISSLELSKLSNSAIEALALRLENTVTPCAHGNSVNGALSAIEDYEIAVQNCMPMGVLAEILGTPSFEPTDTPLAFYDGKGDFQSLTVLSENPAEDASWKLGEFKPTPLATPLSIRWQINDKGQLIIETLGTNSEVTERKTITLLERDGIVLSTKIFHEKTVPFDGSKGLIDNKLYIVAPD